MSVTSEQRAAWREEAQMAAVMRTGGGMPSMVLRLLDALDAAEAELDDETGWRAAIAGVTARAERAEVALRRVEALAVALEQQAPKPAPGGFIAEGIRAALRGEA